MTDMATSKPDRPAASNPKSLSGLLPFLKPYRWQIGLALVLLVLAAATTLLFPWAIRHLIDSGLAPADRSEQVMAMRGNFLMLFGVAVALGIFSAGRFFTVSWLGERVTRLLPLTVVHRVSALIFAVLAVLVVGSPF
jgi:ATP-binding cassette subfamily B protein